ncbi:MAG: DUF4386 family protein [Thermomicrobiales bacterium]
MDGAMAPQRAAVLRFGGGMVLGGTVVWLLLSGLRGAVPGAPAAVLAQAGAAHWRLAHLCTIIAIVVTAAGLALLSGTLRAPAAASAGHASAMIAVPAAAVMGVGFAIEGFVLPGLAAASRVAGDEAAQAMHLAQAGLVLQVVGGTSFAYQTLFGLAIAVMAYATYRSEQYPHWHCWLGMLGGAVWCLAGILSYAGNAQVGFWLFALPVLPVAIWLLGFGWLAWRQAAQPPPAAGAGR